MADYVPIPDKEGSKGRQGPAAKDKNYYDRSTQPATGSFVKSPNYILVNTTLTNTAGFFFFQTQDGYQFKSAESLIGPTKGGGSADSKGAKKFEFTNTKDSRKDLLRSCSII